MTWTRKKPEKPGFYWATLRESFPSADIQVEASVYWWGEKGLELAGEGKWWWAGPVELPESPKSSKEVYWEAQQPYKTTRLSEYRNIRGGAVAHDAFSTIWDAATEAARKEAHE